MEDAAATVRAWIDNSGTKSQLKVEGTVLVYVSDRTVTAKLRKPYGFNPSIAIIDVFVNERPSPMKGTMAPYDLTTVYDSNWTSVDVRFTYDPEPEEGTRVDSVQGEIEGL